MDKMCLELINQLFCCLLFSVKNIWYHKIITPHSTLCQTDNKKVSNLILIITVQCNNLDHLHLTR